MAVATTEMAKKRKPAKEGVISGKRIQTLRKAAGLTQQELAVKANTNAGVIAALEQERTPDPRISTLRDVAAALGVRVDELIVQPPSPTSE